ncbi:DUF397 domain-containing protein [Saccharopolyspora sp. 6T]|uniref:DUF397 domain-containing protein n=1 Tax=Saccharopolyspora sp. 6T TaxID=2877238 RepID=UPI001CD1F158|nr:DUF397 domain-containing protein [Saccharopolyspora sp. 6T]MCA1188344.1 DUF397 domain-containing protein [Saccharopolyspora sp. 6T]
MPTHDLPPSTWRKSSYSSGNHNCVEVITVAAGTGVRDSKPGTASPILAFGRGAFAEFLAAVRDEKFRA